MCNHTTDTLHSHEISMLWNPDVLNIVSLVYFVLSTQGLRQS